MMKLVFLKDVCYDRPTDYLIGTPMLGRQYEKPRDEGLAVELTKITF